MEISEQSHTDSTEQRRNPIDALRLRLGKSDWRDYLLLALSLSAIIASVYFASGRL